MGTQWQQALALLESAVETLGVAGAGWGLVARANFSWDGGGGGGGGRAGGGEAQI